MARLETMNEAARAYLLEMEMPTFADDPWAAPAALAQARVAIVSTAGLHRRDDKPFSVNSSDYRLIPGDVAAADLVMTHVSTNFDRSGFMQDVNVVFPLDRLNDLVREGTVGSSAAFHYSFMGATHPSKMERTARNLSALLKGDEVDAVLLVPV